jgi:hypothetical protein
VYIYIHVFIYIILSGIAKVLKRLSCLLSFQKQIKAQLISISNTQVCLKSVYVDEFQGCKKVFKGAATQLFIGWFCTFVWQLRFNEWFSRLPLVAMILCSLLTAVRCQMCLHWFVLWHMQQCLCYTLWRICFIYWCWYCP